MVNKEQEWSVKFRGEDGDVISPPLTKEEYDEHYAPLSNVNNPQWLIPQCDNDELVRFDGCINTKLTAPLLSFSDTATDITFHIHNQEMMRISDNGDIYIRGKLTDNDMDVVQGFKEFLKMCGCIK